MKKNLLFSLLMSFIFQGIFAQSYSSLHEKKVKLIQAKYCLVKDNYYMGAYEVSQGQYFKFLNDLNTKGETDKYHLYYPDTTTHKDTFYLYPHKLTYAMLITHPQYVNDPISSVSYDAALAYCQWLTDQYNADPKRKFKKVLFRLPYSKEWEFAARGGMMMVEYPWGGPFLRNKKGLFLANFRHVGSESISYDPVKKRDIVVGAEEDENGIGGVVRSRDEMKTLINSYDPNDYGLFNMSGNVAEMLGEQGVVAGGSFRDPGYDVRVSSRKFYTSPSYDIGFRVLMQVMEP